MKLRRSTAPESTWAMVMPPSDLGVLLKQQGRLDEAEAAYRTGIDLGNGRAASSLGVLLEEQGRLDEAEAVYRSGIDLGDGGPPSISASCSRSRAGSTRPRRHIAPESTWATVVPPANLGILLEEQGRFDEAEAAYRSRNRPGRRSCCRQSRNPAQEQGRLDEAEAAYRTGIDLGDGEAARRLGILLEEQGRLDEAEAVYRTGIELGDGGAAFVYSRRPARAAGPIRRGRGGSTAPESTWATAAPRSFSATCSRNRDGWMKPRRRIAPGSTWATLGPPTRSDPCSRIRAGSMRPRRCIAPESTWGMVMPPSVSASCSRGRVDSMRLRRSIAAESTWAHGDAATRLGALLHQQQQLDAAEAAYRTGIDLGGRGAAYSLGDLLEQQGRLEEAEAAYRSGIDWE